MRCLMECGFYPSADRLTKREFVVQVPLFFVASWPAAIRDDRPD